MTVPDDRSALPLRRYWWILRRFVWHIRNLGFRTFVTRQLMQPLLRKSASKKRQSKDRDKKAIALNLKPNDMIEIRLLKEIFATLDTQDKLKGLRFTPEMARFCGKKFRVFKKLDKIILEATGELRKIRTPTYLLEGVFCDGTAHGGCDRSCYCFWREEWLKRIPAANDASN